MSLLPKNKTLLLSPAVCLIFFCFSIVWAQNFDNQKDKPPIIIIPGLVGSELVNSKTGEKVWFKTTRSKTDDLRLPISPDLASNRDNLVPKDILRSLKIGLFPRTQIYASLISALETRGNYREASWENPRASDCFYVFAYDWRRDNTENARLLINKIETLKRRLQKPDLKFDVIAHSMGGLIARYAAMYGDADLPAENNQPSPDWAGAKHFDKIFLLGAPHEGSLLALQSLATGVSFFSIPVNLPFLQNLTKFDFFTIPALYQLLPPNESLRAFDENLNPLKIDLYDPKTWDDYGWNAIADQKFNRNFSAGERADAGAYFAAALDRARRFHNALDADVNENSPVSFYTIGGDCRDTLDAIVIYRDAQTRRRKTLFQAVSFRRADGKLVSAGQLKKIMFAKGDGIVTKHSFSAATITQSGSLKTIPSAAPAYFLCEGHNELVGNTSIQNYILKMLASGNSSSGTTAQNTGKK